MVDCSLVPEECQAERADVRSCSAGLVPRLTGYDERCFDDHHYIQRPEWSCQLQATTELTKCLIFASPCKDGCQIMYALSPSSLLSFCVLIQVLGVPFFNGSNITTGSDRLLATTRVVRPADAFVVAAVSVSGARVTWWDATLA